MADVDTESSVNIDDLPHPYPLTKPPKPMGKEFWGVMTLIGILISLIIYSQVQGVIHPLAVNVTGTEWSLVSYTAPNGTLVSVPPGTDINITFGPANPSNLTGYSACFEYTYRYYLHNTNLTLTGGIVQTIPCDDTFVQQKDSEYLAGLSNSSQVKFRNGDLIFYDSSGKPILLFKQ